HRRLATGFVTDTQMDGEDARIVTFANGLVVRELVVDVDDAQRRLAYAAVGGRSRHHHASFPVLADGPHRAPITWIDDVLPHEVAAPIGEMMEAGARAMQRTLSAAGPRA